MKENPLMQDAIRRHKELLERLPPGTQEYSRSKEIVEECRHNELVRIAIHGEKQSKWLQSATIIIALATLIATVVFRH